MHTLKDWKAKRAGGRITVYGTDDLGNANKLVGVDEISLIPGDGGTVVVAVVNHAGVEPRHVRLIV